MSDNHLFPSPDLSSLFKKAINDSKGKVPPHRRNLHIDPKLLTKDHHQIIEEANSYRRIMASSSIKFRNAISSLKLFYTPEKPTHSQLLFSMSSQPFKKGVQVFQTQKNLHIKTLLEKNIEQETPLVFIKGKINLQVNYEEGLGKLSLRKIINHSKFNFDNLSCLVIATKHKISKNSIFLPPEEYEIVMAQYLNQIIQSKSATASIQLIGEWSEPKNRYLSVLLRDEDTDDILFCTHCYSFKDLVEEMVHNNKVNQKIY